jgi:hypothetical protein
MGKNPPSSMFYRTRLGAAAAAGMFIVCRCDLCRRSRFYLASDLAEIWHPDSFVAELFGGRCPRCSSPDFWRVRERYASNSDVGMLTVRRPAGVRRIQLWKDELYSAPEKKDVAR